MGLQFYETVMGKNFFEKTMPKLVKSIQEHTNAVEKQNELLKKQTEMLEKLIKKMNADQ